ncbi:hypothetical protein MJO29_015477 [Puccinia striiformis f. sp. tritici]|nr:hypothetical protein MJO29_015477 [Puccinia striiformis f. sp. tritici]
MRVQSNLWAEGSVEDVRLPTQMFLNNWAKSSMASVISPLSPQSCHSSHARMLALLGPKSTGASDSFSYPSSSTNSLQQSADHGYFFNPSSSRPNVAFPLYATQVSATALVWDEVNQVRSEAIRPSISSNHPFEKDTPMNVDEPGKIHPPIGVHNSFVEAITALAATEPFSRDQLTSDSVRQPLPTASNGSRRPRGPRNRYYGTTTGRIHLLLLKNCYEKFRKRYEVHKRGARSCALGGRDRHATLPIAMIPPHPPTIQPVKALRIMRGSSDLIQRHSKWLELYKFLIGAMYEIHQELMNRLNVSTFVHGRQQVRLFDWLENEIFSPEKSPPIIGSFFAPTKSWWEDNQFGVTQLELINYFGQDDKDKEHTRLYPTSYALVGTFCTQHERDYPPSSDPDLNTPRQILSSPEFRLNIASLLDLVPDSKMAELNSENIKFSSDQPFSWCSWSFSESFNPRNFRIYGLKTVHPRLPVSMNVLDKPGLGLLQVMRHDETISPVRLEDFRLRLLRLIQAMDYFNLLVREKLKIPQTQAATERRMVIDWLMQAIIDPRRSIPLTGYIEQVNMLAPWEEEEQGAPNSYGITQVELIHYFSGSDASLDLKTLAAFLVTTCYEEDHPKDYKSWTEITKK